MSPPDAPRARTDWFAEAALFIAGLAASMHFAKLAPVMSLVGRDLHLGLIGSGFAVSVIGIVGVLFAISAGAIVASIGLQRGLLIALFGGSAIAAAGSMAPDGATFLGSRFLEGFSHLVIVVCAPALMAEHASLRDRPIALALWGCFFGLGFAIASAVAPAIVQAVGWRGLLASHAGVLALAGGLVALALTRSGYRDARRPFPGPAALLRAHVAVYTSGAPLLLALTFCAYTIMYLAVLTFLGRYLPEARGWSPAEAGSFIALISLVTLAATLASGVLVRFGTPLFVGLVVAFVTVALAAVVVFAVRATDEVFVAAAVVMMAGFGMMPGFVFANVPPVAQTPTRVALTFGAIAQFGNVGTFSGTPIFAAAYSVAGWPGGAAFIVIVSIVGIALAWTLRRSMRVAAGG